jgi:hypothetical protein
MNPTATGKRPPLALWLGLALAALVLIVTAQLATRWLEGDGSSPFQGGDNCPLTQGCVASDGARRVELRLDGAPQGGEPLRFSLQLHGFSPDQVALDLQGVEMFMGHNRYPLTPVVDGAYRAELPLPVCSGGRMQWRARVLLQQGERTEWADFNFWAEAP